MKHKFSYIQIFKGVQLFDYNVHLSGTQQAGGIILLSHLVVKYKTLAEITLKYH